MFTALGTYNGASLLMMSDSGKAAYLRQSNAWARSQRR